MKDELFDELVESIRESGAIRREGWRCPNCGKEYCICPYVEYLNTLEARWKNYHLSLDDVLRGYSKKRKFDELLGPVWISRTMSSEAQDGHN